jgi:hypothetical protein
VLLIQAKADEKMIQESLKGTLKEARKQKRRATLYDRVESTITVGGQSSSPLEIVGPRRLQFMCHLAMKSGALHMIVNFAGESVS